MKKVLLLASIAILLWLIYLFFLPHFSSGVIVVKNESGSHIKSAQILVRDFTIALNPIANDDYHMRFFRITGDSDLKTTIIFESGSSIKEDVGYVSGCFQPILPCYKVMIVVGKKDLKFDYITYRSLLFGEF